MRFLFQRPDGCSVEPREKRWAVPASGWNSSVPLIQPSGSILLFQGRSSLVSSLPSTIYCAAGGKATQPVVSVCKQRAVLECSRGESLCSALPFTLSPLHRLTGFFSITSKPTTPLAAPRWWAGSGPTWSLKSWGSSCPPRHSPPNQPTQDVSSSRSSKARGARSWQWKRDTLAVQGLRPTGITSWNTCLPLSQRALERAGMKQGAGWRVRVPSAAPGPAFVKAAGRASVWEQRSDL